MSGGLPDVRLRSKEGLYAMVDRGREWVRTQSLLLPIFHAVVFISYAPNPKGSIPALRKCSSTPCCDAPSGICRRWSRFKAERLICSSPPIPQQQGLRCWPAAQMGSPSRQCRLLQRRGPSGATPEAAPTRKFNVYGLHAFKGAPTLCRTGHA